MDESIPFLDLRAQYDQIGEECVEVIRRVVASQQFILGPEVSALEEEIASYSHCDYGIGVSSGTDALLVALMAAAIGPGDEVITSPYSFFATAGCVSRVGATPIFVDIEPYGFNLNHEQVAAAVTERTKAIVPIHLFGQIAEMDPIVEIADGFGLLIIEDAAQAIGSEYYGRRAGSIGHLGCFSFYPSKNLGAFGDGGMVVTNDSELAQNVRLLRAHGASPKYYHSQIGGNFRLDAIQAAVLRVKLRYLDEWTLARQSKASNYRQLIMDRGLSITYQEIMNGSRAGVVLPAALPARRHIYNQFVVWVRDRDRLRQYLKDRGIATNVYYPLPLHLQNCFEFLGNQTGSYPISEAAARHSLALPIYPELGYQAQEQVVELLADFFDGD